MCACFVCCLVLAFCELESVVLPCSFCPCFVKPCHPGILQALEVWVYFCAHFILCNVCVQCHPPALQVDAQMLHRGASEAG